MSHKREKGAERRKPPCTKFLNDVKMNVTAAYISLALLTVLKLWRSWEPCSPSLAVLSWLPAPTSRPHFRCSSFSRLVTGGYHGPGPPARLQTMQQQYSLPRKLTWLEPRHGRLGSHGLTQA